MERYKARDILMDTELIFSTESQKGKGDICLF
jgi:hypothetical protein